MTTQDVIRDFNDAMSEKPAAFGHKPTKALVLHGIATETNGRDTPVFTYAAATATEKIRPWQAGRYTSSPGADPAPDPLVLRARPSVAD